MLTCGNPERQRDSQNEHVTRQPTPAEAAWGRLRAMVS